MIFDEPSLDQRLRQRVANQYWDRALKDYSYRAGVKDRIARVMDVARGYPDDLFQLIYDFLSDEATVTGHHLLAAIHSNSDQGSIREYIAFGGLIKGADGGFLPSPKMFLRSLRNYPVLPYLDDYSTVEGQTREQVIALLTVASHLHGYVIENNAAKWMPLIYHDAWQYGEDQSITIKGKELVSLIASRPSYAEVIASIIIDRKTGDAEVIKEVLDSKTTSLMMGTL